MPRPRKLMPDYRRHISGQARVTILGKDYLLGEYDSPESRSRYLALLAEYNETGTHPEQPQQQLDLPVTVRCVTAEFRNHAETKYAGNKSERDRFNSLCTLLDDEYGDEPAADFGPRKLAEIRDLFVVSGNNRDTVNKQTRAVVRIFKHAVSRELIAPDRLVALESLEALRRGQTAAPEPKKVQPVDIEIVKASAKNLSPTLRAIVRIQAATGMRPSEVCNMRPCDIDRSGAEWFYRPDHHKTAHRGKTKAVPIVGDAREALAPFLLRDAEDYCFSPVESARWYRDQRTAMRVTPVRYGNGVGTTRKANPKRPPGNKYSKDSYRRAIYRAADKAGVPRWFPYQLRHTAATVVREALGVEAAQALLGHSRSAMTEHYAQQSERKAIEAARVAPSIG